LVRVVLQLLDAFGRTVFKILYIPLWMVWHGALKHFINTIYEISHEEPRTNWTPEDARRYLATIYFNYCQKKAWANG
jgi:hypothetical protein